MTPVEFEHKISAGERPQTYTLHRTTTGTGFLSYVLLNLWNQSQNRVLFHYIDDSTAVKSVQVSN